MRFRLFGAELCVPFTVLLLLPMMAAVQGADMLPPLLAVLAHELGHIAAARRSGTVITFMRVMPFGATIHTDQTLCGRTEFFVSLCGPCASLVFATLCAGVSHFALGADFIPREIAGAVSRFASGCVRYSLMLFFVNMLPALPLDGGRILRSLLSGCFGNSAAHKVACSLGIAVSAALLIAAFVNWPTVIPAAAFIGALVLLEALRQLRAGAMASVAASLSRGMAFDRTGKTRLATVAIKDSATARSALSKLRGASLVAVMDSDMSYKGSLGEGDLIRGMVEHGPEVTLSKLL